MVYERNIISVYHEQCVCTGNGGRARTLLARTYPTRERRQRTGEWDGRYYRARGNLPSLVKKTALAGLWIIQVYALTCCTRVLCCTYVRVLYIYIYTYRTYVLGPTDLMSYNSRGRSVRRIVYMCVCVCVYVCVEVGKGTIITILYTIVNFVFVSCFIFVFNFFPRCTDTRPGTLATNIIY